MTFNRDAAAELVTRIGARLRPLVPSADEIEVHTLHALARQVLLDAGQAVELVADRLPLLRAARRRCAAARPGLFEDFTHVKFYRHSLRDVSELEGAQFDGFHHVDDWIPQRIVTATGPDPLPR